MADATAPSVTDARRTHFAGVPSWRDPRWGQVGALTLFTILGQTWLSFEIRPLNIVATIATCVALDLILTARRRHEVVVPLSAMISGLGIALLLRSPDTPVFVFAGLMAIGSKHVLTVGGRHRFNPSNFGIIAALAVAQGGMSMVTPGQWGTSGLTIFAIVCAGSLVVFRAERLTLVGLFLAAQAVMWIVFHSGHLDAATSLSGAVLSFAFFMITDPKTAPRSRRGQAGYAVAIALIGQVLLHLGSMDGPFIGLFVVCLAMPLVERIPLADWRTRLTPGHRISPA